MWRTPRFAVSFKEFMSILEKRKVWWAVCEFQLLPDIHHRCLAIAKSPSRGLWQTQPSHPPSFFCNIFNWIRKHETGGYITAPTRDIFLSLHLCLCPHPISLSHTLSHCNSFPQTCSSSMSWSSMQQLRLNAFSNWHLWLCPPPPEHLLPTPAYMLLISLHCK